MDFNKEQQEAIESINGTIQVVASAGSGKTATLIGRIENMISKGIKAEDILAISFTNASANNLDKKLKERKIEGVYSGTFHSICRQLLSPLGIDTSTFPNKYQVKREMEIASGEKNINIEDIMSWIGYQQGYNLHSSAEHFEEKESIYGKAQLRKFYSVYENYCKKNKVLDFGQWLILTHEMYKEGKITKKWKYVSLDEAMDSNKIQHLLAEDFSEENNLFVVGDLRQCIYQWNSAIPELFKNFDKTHKDTKVINLYMNYRSCENIVNAANDFIRPCFVSYDHYKDAEAYNKEKGIIEYHSYPSKEAEARYTVKKITELSKTIALEDIAVIYRNNSSSDYLETELKKRNIEYTSTSSNSFYDRAEIKGIISILRLIEDVTDDEALENVFNVRFHPLTYFKGTLLGELKSEAGKKNISLYEALMDHRFNKTWEQMNANTFIEYISRLKIQKDKKLSNDKIIDNIIKIFKINSWLESKFEYGMIQDKKDGLNNLKNIAQGSELKAFLSMAAMGVQINKKKKKGVNLSTIHKAKGLEFKVVFIIGLEDKKFPSNKASLESEARLFYVACTRSKEQLYISCINWSKFYEDYVKNIK